MPQLSAERVLAMTIELEGLLRDLGARSAGLGNMASELRDQLTTRLHEDLRYLSWARNRVAHEDPNFVRDEECSKFQLAYDISRQSLEELLERPGRLEAREIRATGRILTKLLNNKGLRGNTVLQCIDRQLIPEQLRSHLEYVGGLCQDAELRGKSISGQERDDFEQRAEVAASMISRWRR